MSGREAFRGVVWPRQAGMDREGKPVYRYAVVGVLVTDRTIEGFPTEGGQVLIDGVVEGAVGLADVLPRFRHAESAAPVGDAVEVLTALGDAEDWLER